MTKTIFFILGAGLLIAGTLWAADGDERFSGGAFDGYACMVLAGTHIDEGLPPPGGTVIMLL